MHVNLTMRVHAVFASTVVICAFGNAADVLKTPPALVQQAVTKSRTTGAVSQQAPATPLPQVSLPQADAAAASAAAQAQATAQAQADAAKEAAAVATAPAASTPPVVVVVPGPAAPAVTVAVQQAAPTAAAQAQAQAVAQAQAQAAAQAQATAQAQAEAASASSHAAPEPAATMMRAQSQASTAGSLPSAPAAAPVASSAAAAAAAAAVSSPVVSTVQAAKQAMAGAALPPHSSVVYTVDDHGVQYYYITQFVRLLQGITFAAVVKALCMAGNVLVQVSPFPQIKRWERRGCTGEADAAPYVSIAFGGWQWCFYGTFAWLLTKRSGFLILVHSNCLGALLGTYYTVAFYRLCRNSDSQNSFQRYLSAVASLVVLQMCSIMVLPLERALFLTGLISSFCSFVGALSMLVTVPVVIRTQDSRSIPGALCTCNGLSAMVWCLCGYILEDPLVMCPNIVSCVSSAFCVYLKYRFPSCEDKNQDDLASRVEALDPSLAKLAARKGLLGDHCNVEAPPNDTTPLQKSKPMKIKKDLGLLCLSNPAGGGTGGTW